MKSLKAKLILSVCLLLFITTLVISVTGYRNSSSGLISLQSELIDQKMRADLASADMYLKYYFGELSYSYGVLLDENGQSIEGRNEMVDDVRNDLGNVATIFVASGDDFKRISTNIMTEEGTRAIGTYLGKDSVAYEDVVQGKLYIGEAEILGVPYYTAYEPITDNEDNVIGIMFLGISEEESQLLISSNLAGMRNSFIIIGFLTILLAIGAAFAIGKSIANPISELAHIIDRLAKYDLSTDNKTEETKYIKRNDEIGVIAKALSVMRNNFIDLVQDVTSSSDQVAASSQQLTANSQQTSYAANEVARTIEEMARGAADQAKDTEQGVEHIEEMGSLVEHEQSLLRALNTSTSEVDKLKEEGFVIIHDLVEKTGNSNKAAKEVSDVIINTNESAEKIESASQMIKNIADQTNLLALNAAIEAARAGEAGKGFAVVSEEIRKLAEESNKFTEEIEAIVGDLTGKTEKAVSTMKEVGVIVASQTESVEKTNAKFEGIANAIEKSKEVILELNRSGQEMEQKKEEIIEIMQNLSAIAEENAAGTEEASASVEEQTASMDELASASEDLAKIAEEMQDKISKFKI
ncbi:methyl-accepting chemotaxis protein [Desulfitispora alkaliphila]|uniref:methyl-accepting chemotaxis protein n=1 Tax=Desulfitispora alkaliphila TaxID=622674 RepID=UPI003D1E3341